MKIDTPDTLLDLIVRFNMSTTPIERYALSCVIRAELESYVKTLDDSVIPLYKKAMIKQQTGYDISA